MALKVLNGRHARERTNTPTQTHTYARAHIRMHVHYISTAFISPGVAEPRDCRDIVCAETRGGAAASRGGRCDSIDVIHGPTGSGRADDGRDAARRGPMTGINVDGIDDAVDDHDGDGVRCYHSRSSYRMYF